jgi:hypothetical protein
VIRELSIKIAYPFGLLMTHIKPQLSTLENHRVAASQSQLCLKPHRPCRERSTVKLRQSAVIYMGWSFPKKISGVGTIFRLLVHVPPGPNKQREAKKMLAFELH